MVQLNEGPVQRGNGNGGPTTPKPVILPKGQASARAALAGQQGEGPSESDVAELFYRYMGAGPEAGFENAIAEALARWGHQPARLRNCPTHGQQPPEAWGCPECVRELREELHRTVPVQPTPPAEGEVAEFITQLKSYAEYGTPIRLIPFVIDRAAALLERLSAAALAVVPVPVSERPWEREGWCDDEGRCWIHCPGQSWDTWVLTVPQNAIDGAHCLPATALPLPSGEVEG